MCGIFHYYKSLKNIPDISKWNTKNVTNMNFMFDGCTNLKNKPDISGI